MSYVLSLALAAPGNAVIDLRSCINPPNGSGAPAGPQWHKACRLKVTAIDNTGTASRFEIQPIVVADSASAPSPVSVNIGATQATGTFELQSTKNPSITLGQLYSKGFSGDVFTGDPVATHLLVTCAAVGILQVEVD